MKRQKSFWGRRKFAPAIIIGAMLVISMTPMFAVAASSWDQFQKDEQNSGWTTDLAPLNATKAWKADTYTASGGMPAGVDVVPIVVDGKVFVLDARSYVWAFDAKSGEMQWAKLLSCGGNQFQLATPAYGEGKLFFATNDGHVYALNPEGGHVRWSKKIAETYDQLNTPVTYADGKVYVGSYKSENGKNSTGVYYCLNATTGEVVWTRNSDTGKGYYWTGACVIGDYLVYGDRASVVTSVYTNNGTAIDAMNITTSDRIPFNISDAGGIKSSVAYSEEFCYFTSEGGYVWAIGFNESTGEFTEEGWAFAVDPEIGHSASTPVIYDGRVYMGAGEYRTGGKLYCLNQADNGTEIWNLTVNGGIKASPAISVQHGKPYIYFTTNLKNSSVYCVDEAGNEMWNYTTEEANSSAGYILQGVAIYDGYVYFGNDGGYVYGLNESGPTILWEGNVTLTENTTFNVTAYNSGKSYELNRTNALGALDAAAEIGEFNYSVSDEWYANYGSFMVASIADVESTGAENWLYWVNYPNDPMPVVGVNLYEVKEGDVVTYYYGDGNVTPANASKVIKILVHTNESGPTILWVGNVTLTENTTFNVTAHNSGKSYELNRTNALGALDAAAEIGEFNYSVSDEWYVSYGSLFVDSIADVENAGAEGWQYWVNYPKDSKPDVGVNRYDVKEGDAVTYYYGNGNVTPANASKVIKIRVHTNESGPTVLWEGNVTLTENTTFNVTAYNSGKSYELNRTNALGALDAAAEIGEFNYSVSDEWYVSYGSLFVDSIADVENAGAEGWQYWVNYPKDSKPDVGVNLYDVKEGDAVTYYYGNGNVTPANASKVIKIRVHTGGPAIFDTGTSLNPYPSISGTHNGTITPNKTIAVNRLFTYPCAGTGGHTEFVRILGNDVDVNATWHGYTEDWHNLTFDKPFSLEPNKTYNYTIRTGSYPQIHHIGTLATANGEINCTGFVDGNGKESHAMIPAIMLWKE